MRFLVDMNLTVRWCTWLQTAGFDAIHWSTIGPANAPDEEICRYARSNGFALVTNDLDFPRILATTRAGGPSVVLLRGEPLTPENRGPALLTAVGLCSESLGRGAVLIIDWSGRARARLLPLI